MAFTYMDIDDRPGGRASEGERLFLLTLVSIAILFGVWIYQNDSGEPARGETAPPACHTGEIPVTVDGDRGPWRDGEHACVPQLWLFGAADEPAEDDPAFDCTRHGNRLCTTP